LMLSMAPVLISFLATSFESLASISFFLRLKDNFVILHLSSDN
jgi:hypothetical protein